MSPKNLQRRIDSGTLDDAEYILGKIRGTIAAIRYLGHTATPNVNSYLTSIINNVGAQWRLSQRLHNVNHPNDQTKIGDFWTEWVKDFYVTFIIGNAKRWAQAAIDGLKEAWESSTDANAQEVLDALTSLDTQLKTVTIDTSLWF